jgi:hypothetical protein
MLTIFVQFDGKKKKKKLLMCVALAFFGLQFSKLLLCVLRNSKNAPNSINQNEIEKENIMGVYGHPLWVWGG